MTWLKWYSDQAHRPVIVSTEKPSVPAGGTPGQLLARKLAMTLGQTSFLENSIVLPNRGSLNRADSNLRPSLKNECKLFSNIFPATYSNPISNLPPPNPPRRSRTQTPILYIQTEREAAGLPPFHQLSNRLKPLRKQTPDSSLRNALSKTTTS